MLHLTKKLLVLCSILAAFAISSFPAAAQGILPTAHRPSSSSIALAEKHVPASMISVVDRAALPVADPTRLRAAVIWDPPVSTGGSHGPSVLDSVEMSKTPFGEQYRMPIGSLFGGRIQILGFGTVTATDNILRGLPGAGSFMALSSAPMGQAGIKLPKDDTRYGLSVTFHRPGNLENGLSLQMARCVGWLTRHA